MTKSITKNIITILLLGGGLLFLAGLTSCENFLDGNNVKDEIIKEIEYNNAPECTVLLKTQAEMGEFYPEGEKKFKLGYDSEVQFTVNLANYVFDRLEAVSKSDP